MSIQEFFVPGTLVYKRSWMAFWIFLGGYFIVTAIGAGVGSIGIGATVCGFMAGLMFSDNDRLQRENKELRAQCQSMAMELTQKRSK